MTNSTAAAALVLFDRAPLLAALSYLSASIVEARNTIPIVSCVLIEATDDGARLTGTDLDMAASTIVPAAWDAPGAVAVDARDLLAAVKAITGDAVQLQRVEGAVLVVGDGMTSRVAVLPAADFPRDAVKPLTAAAAAYSTDAATLAHDWSRVLRAVSFEETRYYLNGINAHLIERKGHATRLAYAATDGHRLAVVTRDAPTVTGGKLPGVIIPRKMVAAAIKALGKRPTGDVAIAIDAQRMTLDAAGWSFRSKLIDGTFPDYSRVIPSANDLAVTFDGAQVAAVAGAMSKASKGKGACKLAVAADGGAVLSQTHEDNHRASDIGADWSGGEAQELVIGMNAKYLVDIVASAGGGALVGHFADAAAPMLWKSADAPELVQVLMPMRVGDETRRAAPATKRAAAAVERIESASDVLMREYGLAFVARAPALMRKAIADYRASDEHARTYRADAPHAKLMQAREHYQIAILCARARYRADADGATRHSAKLQRAARVDTALCRFVNGSFKRIGEKMAAAQAQAAARAATLARLEALDGFRADDPRPAVAVQLRDGARGFVRLAQLVDVLNYPRVDLVKADGTYPRRKRISSIHRDDIARICQPRGAKVQPAAAVEPVETVVEAQPVAAVAAETPQAGAEHVAALLATVEALAARVAQLEAMPAPAPVTTPVALYGPPAPALAPVKRERSASEARAILRAWNMRRQLREAREALDQSDGTKEMALTIARNLIAARDRTAARMVKVRADRRTAVREARGMATGLAQAQAHVARLQPLADALAGLIAPPAAAAPSGDNVVALRA